MEDVHITRRHQTLVTSYLTSKHIIKKERKKIQILVVITAPIPSREVKNVYFIRAFGTHEI